MLGKCAHPLADNYFKIKRSTRLRVEVKLHQKHKGRCE